MKHILISLSFIGIIFCLGFKNKPMGNFIKIKNTHQEFINSAIRKVPLVTIEYIIEFKENEARE